MRTWPFAFLAFIHSIFVRTKIYFQRNYLKWLVKNQCASCGHELHVNNKSVVTRTTYLGDHVNFNGMTISGGGTVKIGNYFHSGKDCHIITHVHNYDHGDAIPYDSTYYHKDVVIGDCVWFGEGVTVLGGVKIGDGAIIQAYSTVVSNVPEGGIAGGHPAKVFRYRDMEHYNKLKKEGKFY